MPLTEKSLIARIRGQVTRQSGILTGIGDDCAVLRVPPNHEALITTDFSLEGVHFRREWHPARSVGHRCLTRGLSDIAAMGGQPIAAFLSLALPRNLEQKWIDDFIDGLLTLARRFNVTLAGGDTAESPAGILADIVVLGSVPKGAAILRSGARPGDRIYVTGELGGSAAALHRLMKKPKAKLKPVNFPRHFFPEARVAVGRVLREKKLASAMIDLSDGLSTDLAHLCEESSVGAGIHIGAIPLASIGEPPQRVDLEVALNGGEDYELLFTSRPDRRLPRQIAGARITEIGRITRAREIVRIDERSEKRALKAGGWQHFSK